MCMSQSLFTGQPQMNDCMDAANKGIVYKASTTRHTGRPDEVHELYDGLKHRRGLLEHAAGSVGARGCCCGPLMKVPNRVCGCVRRGTGCLRNAPQGVEQEAWRIAQGCAALATVSLHPCWWATWSTTARSPLTSVQQRLASHSRPKQPCGAAQLHAVNYSVADSHRSTTSSLSLSHRRCCHAPSKDQQHSLSLH